MGTTDKSAGGSSCSVDIYRRAEQNATTNEQIKKNFLTLVDRSTYPDSTKASIRRKVAVLFDWDLIKLFLQMPPEDTLYLDSLKLDENTPYFVIGRTREELDKFKAYFLNLDGSDLMPRYIDLHDLVQDEMTPVSIEAFSVADIERGLSNIDIIYVRKNMGLMGQAKDLYINMLINHVSLRRLEHRKTLILSEVLIPGLSESGEVTTIRLDFPKKKASIDGNKNIPVLKHEDKTTSNNNSSNYSSNNSSKKATLDDKEQRRMNAIKSQQSPGFDT